MSKVVDVRGLKATQFAIRRLGDRTSKGALAAVRKYAQIIADEASKNAPVDEGNLEDAIEVTEKRESQLLGMTGRLTLFVSVNQSKLGDGYKKRKFRYDILMHEGEYTPGKLSREKAAALGRVVGPKYLSRAFQDVLPDLEKELERIQRGIKL